MFVLGQEWAAGSHWSSKKANLYNTWKFYCLSLVCLLACLFLNLFLIVLISVIEGTRIQAAVTLVNSPGDFNLEIQ